MVIYAHMMAFFTSFYNLLISSIVKLSESCSASRYMNGRATHLDLTANWSEGHNQEYQEEQT